MTPTQYQRLVPLFQEVMEASAEQRAHRAQQLCKGDPELLKDLLVLLEAAEEPPDSLDKPFAQLDLERAAPVPSAPGLVLDRFRIVRPLGRGGMGKVFEAVDQQTEHTVAIKLIQNRNAFAQAQRMRFIKEVRSIATLHHPNIVKVYDIGQVEGNLYMVMEYLDGQSLRDLLKSPEIRPAAIFQIMQQTAKGLAFAHANGVIHGDIKPDNVMVLKDGSVKLVDFGVAQQSGLPDTFAQWGGTLPYMAPERLQAQAVPPTEASDIWSVGVTLFECLTRARPFASSEEIIHAPTPLLRWNSALAEQVNGLIERILVKDPAARVQGADEVADELAGLCGDVHSPTETEAPESESRGKTTSAESAYSLPELGFTKKPEGILEANAAVFRWSPKPAAFPKGQKLRIPLPEMKPRFPNVLTGVLFSILLRAIGPIAGVILLGVGIVFAAGVLIVYAPIAFRSILRALTRLPRCRNCHLSMRRASSWSRFAKDKAEVVYGQRDCMSALQYGLWQDAAKLLAIHGREIVSEYGNDLLAPARLCLDFFECDTCCDHAACLTTEERVNGSWKRQPRYYQAYWKGSTTGPGLLRWVRKSFKDVFRVLTEACRFKVSARLVIIVAISSGVVAAMLYLNDLPN